MYMRLAGVLPGARLQESAACAQHVGELNRTRCNSHLSMELLALNYRSTTQNGSTLARPQAASNGRKHPACTGAAETKQHTAPNSPKCNLTNSMRLHPYTRERSNTSTRAHGHHGRSGEPPLKGNAAPSRRQPRCNTSTATCTGPSKPCTALQQASCLKASRAQMRWRHRENYLASKNATLPPEMLLWHRKRCASITPNIELEGTTVATGCPDSANRYGGASEHRESSIADRTTICQAAGAELRGSREQGMGDGAELFRRG